MARTHVLIRLKSDIPLKRVSEILPDHSYLAELSGDGVTVTMRVIEYWVTVEGQDVPEMFCLVTDLPGTEMTRGVARDAALAAAPARKGRRAGQPVRPRDISHARTRRAILAAIRSGITCYTALTSAIGKYRTVTGRNRHRARKAKCASTFPHASRTDTVTRTAEAVITMANNPA